MTLSVSNNPAALLALLNLNRNADQLSQVQDEIATGLKVASPQDNPAVWATAQGQRSAIDGLAAVTSSLNRATSISDVALGAGQTVLDLLNKMKSQALSAQDAQLQTDARQSLNTDFAGLLKQISNTIASASFDGVNLFDGSSTANLRFLANADGSQTVTLSAPDLSLGGAVVTFGATASIGTAAVASAVMAQIDASISNLTSALANIGDQAKLITNHISLVNNLSGVLQAGVIDLVSADTAADRARLKALQVAQQIGQQSLSIANSTPQILLALFR
jgi:flagellin